MYPQFPHSMQISLTDKPNRYVVEIVRSTWSFGRMYVEVYARGKAPAWREVKRDGPTYCEVLNARGTLERLEDMRPDPESPDNVTCNY